jgi:hypothetical protein
MTVTYSLPSSLQATPAQINVPAIDQADITRIGDSSSNDKAGNSTYVTDYILAGSSLLEAVKIRTTVTQVGNAQRYAKGYDSGPTSNVAVKLSAPYKRVDSVSGAEDVAEISVTIAVNMPQTVVDPAVILDVLYSTASLFVSAVDGTSHEPETDNVNSLLLAGQPW